MHGLEAKYDGCIDFVYLDIDDPSTQPAKARFGYRAQPEFYLVDASGQVIWKKYGFASETELEMNLQNVATRP